MEPAIASARESAADPGLDDAEQLLRQVLAVVRRHLGMEVAFISRVADGRRLFDLVDSGDAFAPLRAGDSDPVGESYCGRVLSGAIPGFIIDAQREPGVQDIAATTQWPIGSHLSVPVTTRTGGTYGTLCCFSRTVNPELTQAHMAVLEMFAEIVGTHLQPVVHRRRAAERAREGISELLDDGGPALALQPIVDVASGYVYGYEALARFPQSVSWTPDQWFTTAHQVGMGAALESAAVHAALRVLPALEEHLVLAINVSAPALIDSASITRLFERGAGHRLILEITEHQRIGDPRRLDDVLRRVRDAGVRIAVDDAGSGYSGLERILALGPEVLKLDRSLVAGVATDPGRLALCEAMVGFTRRTGARLVAEGVENPADLATLRGLGVNLAQGFLLGRPTMWTPPAR